MENQSPPAQASDEPMPFPPMPLPIVKHEKLGHLFDRFAMHQYALRYADLTVAALKAQPAPTEAQGEWQLVPVELTDDMLVAFAEVWYSKRRAIDDCEMADCYAAMLAAAPQAPADVYVSANVSAISMQDLCNTSNNSSSSQSSGNTGELVQGEDSARLECLNVLMNSGAKAWPRSCHRCGLGPCQTGTKRTAPQPQEAES